MKKKLALLSLLTLGICSVALAAEYKEPEVKFKKHSVPSKEMRAADFGDYYKVESGIRDRQIASEEEEREPSSVVKVKRAEPVVDEKVEAPKPWLYRTEEAQKH